MRHRTARLVKRPPGARINSPVYEDNPEATSPCACGRLARVVDRPPVRQGVVDVQGSLRRLRHGLTLAGSQVRIDPATDIGAALGGEHIVDELAAAARLGGAIASLACAHGRNRESQESHHQESMFAHERHVRTTAASMKARQSDLRAKHPAKRTGGHPRSVRLAWERVRRLCAIQP